jgi:ATP synthase protein I
VAFFQKSDASMVRTAYELSAGMLSFVVALAIGWWFGGTLDRWFGTAPWLTGTFTALGLVAGLLNVYRTLKRAMGTRESGPPVHGR